MRLASLRLSREPPPRRPPTAAWPAPPLALPPGPRGTEQEAARGNNKRGQKITLTKARGKKNTHKSYLERRENDLFDGGEVALPQDLRLLPQREHLGRRDGAHQLGDLATTWTTW